MGSELGQGSGDEIAMGLLCLFESLGILSYRI